MLPQVDASGRGLIVRLRTERGLRMESEGRERPGIGAGRPPPGEIDECKLYVAGLQAHAREEDMRSLFGR